MKKRERGWSSRVVCDSWQLLVQRGRILCDPVADRLVHPHCISTSGLAVFMHPIENGAGSKDALRPVQHLGAFRRKIETHVVEGELQRMSPNPRYASWERRTLSRSATCTD